MESPPDPSPRLPWEVIERTIGYCHSPTFDELEFEIPQNPKKILNFSLTCRELRPRSLCLLVAHPVFSSRNKILDFCDFLQVRPHLKPLVRSIAVYPSDFAPVPLLRTLPNLSEVNFANVSHVIGRTIALHPSTLTCCQRLSMHTQTLCLHDVSFETELQFLQLLSAFPNISHLVCVKVLVLDDSDEGCLNMAKQRLAQRLRLLTLTTDDSGRVSPTAMLLLGWEWVQSTLESLTVEVHVLSRLSPWRSPSWCQLRYLKLKVRSSESAEITSSTAFLQLDHIRPKEVVVEIYEQDLVSFPAMLAQNADLYQQLESALLRFSQPQLTWIMNIFPIRRNSFWMEDLENRFPGLLQRGALAMVSNPVLRGGHTWSINTIIISPDNKWVASTSINGTIILSDINGAEVQKWVPCHVNESLFLAFSSDSQHLVSCSYSDMRLVIWNIHEGRPEVLRGHTERITECVWSPVGDLIASGSDDATVRLWDAKTLRPRHVLEHPAGSKIELVEFSPDGLWLITASYDSYLPFSYYIWDVVSGTGRRMRMPVVDQSSDADVYVTAAAFDPGNKRCVVISTRLGGLVEILEVDDGEMNSSIIIGGSESRLGQEARGVAFSSDGNLVLTVPNNRARTHAMRIWDAYTGVELLSLEGHSAQVESGCFSPCGRFVASALADWTVRLWSTRDGSCLATLTEHNAPLGRVVFSPDGNTLVSGALDGSVIIRRMCDILPIDEPGLAATRT